MLSYFRMPKSVSILKVGCLVLMSSTLLVGCGDKLTWQEKLCVNAIKKMARYGYEIHEVSSKGNAIIKTLTDVIGSVTLDDGFGAKRKESFRCSIENDVQATPNEEDVRVWFYKGY